ERYGTGTRERCGTGTRERHEPEPEFAAANSEKRQREVRSWLLPRRRSLLLWPVGQANPAEQTQASTPQSNPAEHHHETPPQNNPRNNVSDYDISEPHEYDHQHANVSSGWLRAAVFGAMEGL